MHNCVVSKIRVFEPNRKSSSAANREFCKYIATRPGVDITNINEDRLSSGLDNENYIKYISERPHSHGLFGNIDVSNLNSVSGNIENLTKQGKNIFRGIISLSEDDARDLGYFNKDKWSLLLNSSLPDIANVFDIKVENLQWIAAFHFEQGHPHVHYMMWDTSSKVQSSYIHVSKQHKCREIISKEIFREEYKRNVLEKTTARDSIIEMTKDSLNDALQSLNRILDENYKEKIPDRIYPEELKTLSNHIIELSNSLPTKGRMMYAYMPGDVKEKIDEISSLLLDRADIGREFYVYKQKVDAISQNYSNTAEEKRIAQENAQNDIMKRIGNIVLRSASNLRNQYGEISKEILKKEEGQNVSFDVDVTNDVSYDNQIEQYDNENFEHPVEVQNNSFVINDKVDVTNNASYDNQSERYHNKNFAHSDTVKHHSSTHEDTNPLNKILWTHNYKIAKKLIYGTPKNKENIKKGIRLMFSESNNGNSLAMYDLAMLHKNGVISDVFKNDNFISEIDFSKNYFEKALKRFHELERSTNSGYLQYRIGKMYLYGQGTDKDYNQANVWIKKSLDNNCPFGHYTYASMCRDGKGTEKDMKKAFYHYEKAANSNVENYYAFYEMGKMYSSGTGVDKNDESARICYKKALNGFIKLDKKNPDDKLKYRIGMMFLKGLGTEINMDLALKYLEGSADLNNPYAQIQLYKLYSKMDDIQKQMKGFSYLVKAANNKNDFALYELGKILINKQSGHYDYDKGIALLKEAAQKGNDSAKFTLAKEYLDKTSFYYNPSLGISLLTELADKKNHYALYALAKIYLDENNFLYNESLGLKYLFESANLGNAYAQLNLGKLYFFGKHVEKDESKAREWTKKSIDNDCESAKSFQDFMDNCKANMALSQSYKLINSVLQSISKDNLRMNQDENLYQKDKRKKRKLGINKFDETNHHSNHFPT